MKHRIISIIGTRPEAIKMAPVILELRRRSDRFEQTVVNTAQHREILDQVLHSFAITPDVDLGLMRHNQDLAEFASRSLSALHHVFAERRPDLVLILRRRTERPELVETGGGVLVGMDADRIVQEAGRLLTDPGAYRRMQLGENPFGDGRAAQKIVAILADRLRR